MLAFAFPSVAPCAIGDNAEISVVAPPGSAPPETLIVQITLNQENKGEFLVVVSGGDFLVRAQDLKAMGLSGAPGGLHKIDGDNYVSLRSIAALQFRFDEKMLALDLTAAPALLPKRTLDLGAGRSPNVLYPADTSAFVNYSVSHSGGEQDTFGFANEFGARIGDFLFLTDTTYTRSSSERKFVRLASSLVYDRRDTLHRFVAGDFFAASGELGALVNMGGLSFTKLYNIDPYFIRYPQQNITGQVGVPSDVDVYIDGQRIRSIRLAPGQFELSNINEAVGSRNVALVIRDAFGREQRIAYPFYSTDVALRAGLHEYSYNVGALRQDFGTESDRYGPLAFSAFHRYGVSDTLTLGLRGEGERGFINAGPTATMILGPAGVLSVAAAASDRNGKRGGAALAGYSYVGRAFSVGLTARMDSRDYASLIETGAVRRNYEINAALGYFHPRAGSFSVGYSTLAAYEGQGSKSASAGYSRTVLGNRASVFVTLRNTRAQQSVNQVFAGFIYNFEQPYSASVFYQRFGKVSSESAQVQKALPVGEGLGYSFSFNRIDAPGGDSTQFAPSMQYNSPWGTLRADYAQQTTASGTIRSHQIAVAGGIAYVGDTVAIGRPVTDSFGLVRVADVEGVRVLVNDQPIGRTDARGRLFVPELTSFTENQVTINTANVPLEYSFAEASKRVSPAYRAGSVIDFSAKRIQAVTGRLKIRLNGELRPAEFYEVTLLDAGTPRTFRTGHDGEYYVEDLPAGHYHAKIGTLADACTFVLAVPQTREPFVELPELICEPAS